MFFLLKINTWVKRDVRTPSSHMPLAALRALSRRSWEFGHLSFEGMVGLQKVDQSLELRDERAGATGGRFGMPQAALIQLSYHSCIALKRGSTIKTGIEGVSLHAAICPDRDQPKAPLFV